MTKPATQNMVLILSARTAAKHMHYFAALLEKHKARRKVAVGRFPLFAVSFPLQRELDFNLFCEPENIKAV